MSLHVTKAANAQQQGEQLVVTAGYSAAATQGEPEAVRSAPTVLSWLMGHSLCVCLPHCCRPVPGAAVWRGGLLPCAGRWAGHAGGAAARCAARWPLAATCAQPSRGMLRALAIMAAHHHGVPHPCLPPGSWSWRLFVYSVGKPLCIAACVPIMKYFLATCRVTRAGTRKWESCARVEPGQAPLSAPVSAE